MKTIKVGGVPEHFNLPWHLCIEEKRFETRGLNVIWKDFPGGTGAMNKALRSGEIDVAVILTEGILKDIISGNESKIVQSYIGSPLIWGIHVAAGSKFKSVEELKNTRAAISRKGSGSHLMAYVNAQNHQWGIDDLQFEIVKDLNGAVKALSQDNAQYFMWEHFTTKPLVDNHTFRRLADCPTPWSCFVIAARNESLKNDSERLKIMLEILNRETRRFKDLPKIAEKIAEKYDQRIEDIQNWLNITHWSQEQITDNEIEKVQDKLLELNLISKKQPSSEFIYNL
ncbi:ABC-type nitrate/sulfonate/bicarbonate transport system substrate-binding protein [Salegentibacter sp. 24]|jgi:ABC-type nitrate/sulfonate/bicarbonate transport system substrate-binding protein|uniref:substrate-binding domain-containing protein n=1 Tax=Salegentibacter sp. 24 TaxID=2183986 RepID=UPI00105DD08A|nr:substrate-binding domain-containing protein [Salegentibacter sp. 24]TDN89374.1 ABC-type nitrate/sulfonate/bicarbonate transport system substrate-binding protein [Salegentibacter sp. 24]